MFSMFGRQNEVKTHECKRCGESKYKEIIEKKEKKVVKFRRYSNLAGKKTTSNKVSKKKKGKNK